MSTLVEPRWVILLCKDCGQRAHNPGDRCLHDRRRTWTQMVEMPVVPCDEAAVERVAQRLYDTDDSRPRVEGPDGEVTSDWSREPDGYRWLYRERARTLLSAAGETE